MNFCDKYCTFLRNGLHAANCQGCRGTPASCRCLPKICPSYSDQDHIAWVAQSSFSLTDLAELARMASPRLAATSSAWTPIGLPSARLPLAAKNHRPMAIFLCRRRSDSDADCFRNRRRRYFVDRRYCRHRGEAHGLSLHQAQLAPPDLFIITPFLLPFPLPLCLILFLVPRRGGPRGQ